MSIRIILTPSCFNLISLNLMKKCIICLFFFLTFYIDGLLAETVYVSDQLETSLRRGEGIKFKILRMVKSGEALEIIEINGVTGYTKIRTSGGTEGYVLSRHLMNIPSARKRLDGIKNENQQLRETISTLQGKLSEQVSIAQQKTSLVSNLESEKLQLTDELEGIRDATANVVAIKQRNSTLADHVNQLSVDKETLETENRAYRDDSQRDWFIRGAGVILLGVLIGLVLPKLRRRQRWGDL